MINEHPLHRMVSPLLLTTAAPIASSSQCTPMASLALKPSRITNPTLQFRKINFSFTFLPKNPFNLSSKTSQFFPESTKDHLKSYHVRLNSVSERSVPVPEVAGVDGGHGEDYPTDELSYLDPESDPKSISEWELDFCSRPILDIRGKKIWELLVCDDSLSLQYAKYFPNNVINSVTLTDAIVSIGNELGVPLPKKIRYFRSLMLTIVTKACNELGIRPIPSKRCLSLLLWLEERYETVYMRHPGFQKGSKPLLTLDNPFPMKLPENLYGEKWAFVQLPFSAVRAELSSLQTRFAFGTGLDLDLLGIEINDNTLIPGLAVASSRAQPLAAWMNGLEVCSVEADVARACLILSVGISKRYIYATYTKTPAATTEAEAWEAAKKGCEGVHFLAIQEDLDSENCVGFWLLLDMPPPPV